MNTPQRDTAKPPLMLSKIPSVKQLLEPLGFQHASFKDTAAFTEATHSWRKSYRSSNGQPASELLLWNNETVQWELRVMVERFLDVGLNGERFWSSGVSWRHDDSTPRYPEDRERIIHLLIQLFWKQNRYAFNNSHYQQKGDGPRDLSVDETPIQIPTPSTFIAYSGETANFKEREDHEWHREPRDGSNLIMGSRLTANESERRTCPVPTKEMFGIPTKKTDSIFEVLDDSDDGTNTTPHVSTASFQKHSLTEPARSKDAPPKKRQRRGKITVEVLRRTPRKNVTRRPFGMQDEEFEEIMKSLEQDPTEATSSFEGVRPETTRGSHYSGIRTQAQSAADQNHAEIPPRHTTSRKTLPGESHSRPAFPTMLPQRTPSMSPLSNLSPPEVEPAPYPHEFRALAVSPPRHQSFPKEFRMISINMGSSHIVSKVLPQAPETSFEFVSSAPQDHFPETSVTETLSTTEQVAHKQVPGGSRTAESPMEDRTRVSYDSSSTMEHLPEGGAARPYASPYATQESSNTKTGDERAPGASNTQKQSVSPKTATPASVVTGSSSMDLPPAGEQPNQALNTADSMPPQESPVVAVQQLPQPHPQVNDTMTTPTGPLPGPSISKALPQKKSRPTDPPPDPPAIKPRPKTQVSLWIITRTPRETIERWDDGKFQGTDLPTFIEGISRVTQRSNIEKLKLTLRTPMSDTKVTVLQDDEDSWVSAKAKFVDTIKEARKGRGGVASTAFEIYIEPFYGQAVMSSNSGDEEDDDLVF